MSIVITSGNYSTVSATASNQLITINPTFPVGIVPNDLLLLSYWIRRNSSDEHTFNYWGISTPGFTSPQWMTIYKRADGTETGEYPISFTSDKSDDKFGAQIFRIGNIKSGGYGAGTITGNLALTTNNNSSITGNETITFTSYCNLENRFTSSRSWIPPAGFTELVGPSTNNRFLVYYKLNNESNFTIDGSSTALIGATYFKEVGVDVQNSFFITGGLF